MRKRVPDARRDRPDSKFATFPSTLLVAVGIVGRSLRSAQIRRISGPEGAKDTWTCDGGLGWSPGEKVPGERTLARQRKHEPKEAVW